MDGKLALWDRWSLALESDTWKALDIFLEAQEHLGVWEDRTLVTLLHLGSAAGLGPGSFPVSLSLPSTWLTVFGGQGAIVQRWQLAAFQISRSRGA